MATFFRSLFNTKTAPTTNRRGNEDVYQTISNCQPQNVYQEVLLLQGHQGPVKHIQKINDSFFATAGDDGFVFVWDSEDGCLTPMYHDFHTSPITSMIIVCTDEQFSEDINNHMIVTASHKELIAWELNSSGPVELGVNVRISTEHNGTINCLCILQHDILCSGGKDICLWDISSGKLLSKYDRSQIDTDPSEIHSMVEIDGRNFGIIAASNYLKPAFYEIKKSTMTQTAQYHLQFNDNLLSFHNGIITCLVSVSSTLFATGAEDGTVILWSVNSLSAIKKFEGTKDEFNDSMTLSQSTTSSTSVTPIVTMGPSTSVNHILILCQKYLFVAIGNGFKVFDVFASDISQATHELQSIHKPLVVHTQAHTDTINHMEFLTNSTMLLTASSDGEVRLWKPNMALIPFKDTSIIQDEVKHSVELFCGLHSVNQQSTRGRKKLSTSSQYPSVPVLVGELSLHAEAVQCVLHLDKSKGLVTCSDDSMVLLWKNLELEDEKRDIQLQKNLKETYYDATS